MRPNKDVLAANNIIAEQWIKRLNRLDRTDDGPASQISRLASLHRSGKACKVIQRIQGAFNYCFRIRFDEDDEQWILRFPMPGNTMNPLRKVQAELAVMRFVQHKTAIPIPKVIASGEVAEIGPYILMEFVPGDSLDDVILDEDGRLRQDVDEATIRKIYRQLAKMHLQLSACPFDKIGSLSMTAGREWGVGSGPLTFKSNEMERMGAVKSEEFLGGPCTSSLAYVDALLDQSLRHLQDNPMASDDQKEAREDYRAIHALKSAASSFYRADKGGFLLFNDDMRFGNIIVDKDSHILAVLDWEFSYSAPASFLQSPPSWLIGLEPFEFEEDDLRDYDQKLDLFIELLSREEGEAHCGNDLSTAMRKFRDDGTFWFNIAVREPFPLKRIMQQCWKLGAIRQVCPPEDVDEFARKSMEGRRKYLGEHGGRP